MARVGVDVGGTTTDFVLEAEHGVYFRKVASTPHDQSEGVLKGLAELCDRAGIRPIQFDLIVLFHHSYLYYFLRHIDWPIIYKSLKFPQYAHEEY